MDNSVDEFAKSPWIQGSCNKNATVYFLFKRKNNPNNSQLRIDENQGWNTFGAALKQLQIVHKR